MWKPLLINDLTATTIYEESVCVFIIVPNSQLALTVVALSERQRAYGTNKVSRDATYNVNNTGKNKYRLDFAR